MKHNNKNNTLVVNILNEVNNYYNNKHNYLTESDNINNSNSNLLQSAITSYQNTNYNDIEILDYSNDFIAIQVDNFEINIDFDYQVLTYDNVPDTYDNPGYTDFESSIEPTNISITNQDTEEDSSFSDPHALKFAQQILDDYQDTIDDNFMSNNSPQDYMDSCYDPDEAYDSRFDF